MNRILNLALASVLLTACAQSEQAVENCTAVQHPDWTKNAVIYELNVRQFTPEGTFAAVENHLDRLEDLGVDVLWMMPIHPIGVEGRKGTLGSYYSVKDYRDVNPEFGTLEDFRHFLEVAHSKGFKVILDWVANHTSRDHAWTVDHKDWYYLDSLGELATQYDWTDIARLKYEENDGLRKAMSDEMEFWVDFGIDGFRCDVAEGVPEDFWTPTFNKLREKNPDLFFIAEGESPQLQQTAFDAYYPWQQMHTWYAVAEGTVDADSLARFYSNYRSRTGMPVGTNAMNFTSNHDQNSWHGTDVEKFGRTRMEFTALTYLLPGMPLIYTGQEASLDKRLVFFEKDTVDWIADKFDMEDFYEDLIEMRDEHCCLWAEPWGGKMEILSTSDSVNVLAFQRVVKGDACLAVFNFSDQSVACNVDGQKVVRTGVISLPAFGYSIFFKDGDKYAGDEFKFDEIEK